MTLTSGINHIALLTGDMDACIAFYTDVFDARLIGDMEEDGLRHAFIDVGAGAVLHPFCIAGNPHAAGSPQMFDRGHLDHFALNVADRETFERLRTRLVEHGASNGTVDDFGSVRTVGFRDPDGFEGEIALWQDGPTLTLAERIVEPYAVSIAYAVMNELTARPV